MIIRQFLNRIIYHSDRIEIVENESRSVKHIVKDQEARIKKLEQEKQQILNNQELAKGIVD